MRCFTFTCSRCGFSANVSGRTDYASRYFTTTIRCDDCRTLYDVVTHIHLPARFALKLGIGLAASQVRLPSQIRKTDLGIDLPDHVHLGTNVDNSNPVVPPGHLISRPDSRWVALKIRCPASLHHLVDEWHHPGRCPLCQTYLDKTLLPYRIAD